MPFGKTKKEALLWITPKILGSIDPRAIKKMHKVSFKPENPERFFILLEAFSPSAERRLWQAMHALLAISPHRKIDSLHVRPELSYKPAVDQSAIYLPLDDVWIAANPEVEAEKNSSPAMKSLAEFFKKYAGNGQIIVHAQTPNPAAYWRGGGLGASIPTTFQNINLVLVHNATPA
jgi:hypothetical protein